MPTYVYTFYKDINVKKYLDNLKRPLTTLYVTILLRNNLGYFDYPRSMGGIGIFPTHLLTPLSNSQIVKVILMTYNQ